MLVITGWGPDKPTKGKAGARYRDAVCYVKNWLKRQICRADECGEREKLLKNGKCDECPEYHQVSEDKKQCEIPKCNDREIMHVTGRCS